MPFQSANLTNLLQNNNSIAKFKTQKFLAFMREFTIYEVINNKKNDAEIDIVNIYV